MLNSLVFYYNPSSSAAGILGKDLVFGILSVKLHSHQCHWGNDLFLCLKKNPNSTGFWQKSLRTDLKSSEDKGNICHWLLKVLRWPVQYQWCKTVLGSLIQISEAVLKCRNKLKFGRIRSLNTEMRSISGPLEFTDKFPLSQKQRRDSDGDWRWHWLII